MHDPAAAVADAPPLQRLYERDPRPPAAAPDQAADARTRTDPERALRCRSCGAEIARACDAIEVDGQHRHTFFNPAGILFEIGCFAAAAGAAVHGEPSTEFAWFAGHSWRYALCGRCGQHLGWLFEGSVASRFFGLILRQLVES